MQQEVDHEDQTQDLLESESSPREGDDASAKPAAPGLSRRQKMSAARLERRRAVDRESQRATRARTKAYITQLENNIAVMEQNATNGHTSTLVRQVQQKQEEIDRLNGLVTNVRKLLNATIGNNGDKSKCDRLWGISAITFTSICFRRRFLDPFPAFPLAMTIELGLDANDFAL